MFKQNIAVGFVWNFDYSLIQTAEENHRPKLEQQSFACSRAFKHMVSNSKQNSTFDSY